MIRDMEGNVVPVGKTIRKMEECFFTTTLPGWMQLNGNGGQSSKVVLPHEDYGYIQVSTGAAIDSEASIDLLPNGVDMSKIKEIVIELDSLVFSSNENDIEFYLQLYSADKNNGICFFGSKDLTKGSYMRAKNETSPALDIEVFYYNILRLEEWKRRKNLVMRVRNNGTIIIGEGDNTFLEYKFTTTRLNLQKVLYPKVLVKTKVDSSQWMRISRVGLTLFHN